MLRSIVYTSSAAPGVSEADLADILNASRVNNARWHLSGVLLFEGGSFLQVVEGPSWPLERAMRRIETDRRHTGLDVLSDVETDRRCFGDWAMGYQTPDGQEPGRGGSFDLSPEAMAERIGWDAPPVVRVMVDTFFKVNRRFAA